MTRGASHSGGRRPKSANRHHVRQYVERRRDPEHRRGTGLSRHRRDDYTHATVNHKAGEYVRGDAGTNEIESVFAVLAWPDWCLSLIIVSPKHLDRYVDEFSFRLNDGNVKNQTLTRRDNFLCKAASGGAPYLQRIDPMTKPTSENVPKALDAIADVVLAYKPKPKSNPAKKRKNAP